MITKEQALEVLDNMDDFARMTNIEPVGPLNVLKQYIEESDVIINPPRAVPACCVCGSTENLHEDGWYGYRCDSVDCICY